MGGGARLIYLPLHFLGRGSLTFKIPCLKFQVLEVSSLGISHMKGIFVDCFDLLLGFVPGITWKFLGLFYSQGSFDKYMLDLGSLSGAFN